MADKSYVVTAACAMVKVGDRFVTVANGGAVPTGADEEHVQVLLGRGLIAEGEPAGGFEVDPDAPPPFRIADTSPDDVDGEGPIPAKSANKDVWVAYAVSQGATQEEAEALTKDQLIEQYGGA